MVIISLKTKMLIIYSIIIILVLTGVSILILNNYKTTRIKNEEIRLFKTANIVADTYKGNMDDVIFSKFMVRSYGGQANARILIIDSNKKVLIDNYNSYGGKKIDNYEIKSSLKGKAKSGLYKIRDREVLQLAVPITINLGTETKVIGSVLVSASMEMVNNDIANLRLNTIKISTIGLLVSLLLVFLVTNNLTKPIKNLIQGVEKISKGQLGYRVKSSKGKEIGLLINSFNEMSRRLKHIEENRRKTINNISHELKTPLTSIKTLIGSLEFGEKNIDLYEEYLQDIYKETERMENLVNYIMASIRLEDISLDMSKENIGDILKDTVRFIQPYAKKNKVELNLVKLENVIVECDKDKVKEIILNLLDNAIKYRDWGKNIQKVNIFLKKEKNEGILIIEDNGIGISKDNLKNIFNRNFRVVYGDFPTYGEKEGYGIGLSIVKHLVEKHKWTISVESSIGIGSRFLITIPL